MPILRHWPNCLGRLRIADALIGRRVRCPLCQTAFFGEGESFAETQAIL